MLCVNMNGKIVVLILLMILFVSACGRDDVDIDYLGDSYTPTSHVDVYFSEDDVTEAYLVMGHATADGGTTETLQETLIEKARENGADGIIFEGFDRVETGEQTIVNNIGDTTSIVNTDTTSVLQVKAIFIKYNKNL